MLLLLTTLGEKIRNQDEKWGLFWCNLLHDIIFEEIEKLEVNRHLKKLCEEEYLFPDGKRKKVSLSTLRRKLNQYRSSGFKGLFRMRRKDQGKVRSFDQEIIDKAVELKKDQPFRSDDAINRFLKDEFGKSIPKSTLYRHLRLNGATKLKLGISKKKVRKRWTRNHTHDLWVGDFEEGPYVLVDGEVLPTYLSLFVDCYSRYVVEARYYLRQNLDVLMDSLLRAWAIHGASNGLYLDQAKVYLSNALKAACYQLSIKLLHRARGDPPPGGIVERVFGTTQNQFEAEVRASDILTLDELNKGFSAYLEVVYHSNIHSETGQPPKERYQHGLREIRHVDMSDAIRFFMSEVGRTVDKIFSDVRVENRYFRVSPKLRGDKVKVKYDPFADMQKVFIYSLHDEYLGEGKLYNREYGDDTEKPHIQGKSKYNYIKLLNEKHEKILNDRSKGIDYRKVFSQRKFSFSAFAQKLAILMGKKGGLTIFRADELEILKKTYNRFGKLNEPMLIQAWEKASEKNIPHLIYQLQIINDQRR